MKAKPECIACMFKQALNTTRVVTDDPDTLLTVMQRLAQRIATIDLDNTPAFVTQDVYTVVSEVTGVEDPFAERKKASNALALRVLAHVREVVLQSPDPLAAAIHLAAVGNVMDSGIGHINEVDVEADVVRMLDHPFGIFDIEGFRRELGPGKRLLYLGDNAGEIVLDTVLVDLIRESGTDIIYSVKSGPIIDDAMMEDAIEAGMTDRVKVIETGSNDIGVNFENTSVEFRDAFSTADIILAKGHGNFETCNSRPENIYFLLKAKCEAVARELGVNVDELVFKHCPNTSAGL